MVCKAICGDIISMNSIAFYFPRYANRIEDVLKLAKKEALARGVFFGFVSSVPWSQRFSFAAKRQETREKEAARENLWLRAMRISLSCYDRVTRVD